MVEKFGTERRKVVNLRPKFGYAAQKALEEA
jgi:hypothetical protein